MEMIRFFLFAVLAVVAYVLWIDWQIEHPRDMAPVKIQAAATSPFLPSTIETNEAKQETESKPDVDSPIQSKKSSKAKTSVENTIYVETDVLKVAIDLQQGNIIEAKLLAYPLNSQENTPFTLLHQNLNQSYAANSDLFTTKNKQIKNLNIRYRAEHENYQLQPDQKQLIVTLTGTTEDGVEVKKQFIFVRNSYLIDMKYSLLNKKQKDWTGYLNLQLFRSSPEEDKSSMLHIGSFTGASYSNPGQSKYKKVTFKDMEKSNLQMSVLGGWVAMQQHYFLTAWIPNPQNNNHLYTQAVDDNYSIGMVPPAIHLSPNKQEEIGAQLYIGPEITSTLKAIAPGLDLTVDYGLLWFLSSFLFSIMKTIYSVVGNWGWAIVLVTILIKLAFYRLSATSYKSMASMRRLQPKLQTLRERYGDDKAKISQATMELYRQEKVNPLGGCLPIIVQIPVFIALYWVLFESVELRQAPFILWIQDLASPDPLHILPIIMGATMLIQQKLNPAPPDPAQAKIMMVLPVLFTGLFWNFPSGLVLYWIVQNTLSILQQWYITRKFGDNKQTK